MTAVKKIVPISARWRVRMIRRKAGNLVLNTIIAIFALFPILWGLSSSLKPIDEIVEYPPRLIPRSPTLEHYVRIFNDSVGFYIMNSALVTIGAIVISLIAGAMGAYALARFQFRGRGLAMIFIVGVMSIPIASLLVPTFSTMSVLGLLNTRIGLILLYSAYQLPIVIWTLYGYFLTLPVELENAARIDGYDARQVLWKIVLPLSKPGLVAAALFVAVFAWNDFVVAVTMTSSEAVRTLPVAIYDYLGFYGREWGPLLAASVVSILPIVAVFLYLQRYFVSGLTGGGIKG